MKEKFIDTVKKILLYLSVDFAEEDHQTLLDFSELSGDDAEDIFKRKLVADLAVAKKLRITDMTKFLKIVTNVLV